MCAIIRVSIKRSKDITNMYYLMLRSIVYNMLPTIEKCTMTWFGKGYTREEVWISSVSSKVAKACDGTEADSQANKSMYKPVCFSPEKAQRSSAKYYTKHYTNNISRSLSTMEMEFDCQKMILSCHSAIPESTTSHTWSLPSQPVLR